MSESPSPSQSQSFIRHIVGVAEIVDDLEASLVFYRDVLKLPVELHPSEGYVAIKMGGPVHFGLWSRAAAAESLYGSRDAIDRIALGYHVEFEVDEVGAAADAIAAGGIPIAQPRTAEPWGQVLARFFTPGGALTGITETPWARQLGTPER